MGTTAIRRVITRKFNIIAGICRFRSTSGKRPGLILAMYEGVPVTFINDARRKQQGERRNGSWRRPSENTASHKAVAVPLHSLV